MSRSPRTDAREHSPGHGGGPGGGSSSARDVTKDRHGRAHDRTARDARQPVRGRDRVHRLRQSEWETLRTVGTFRVIAEADLLRETSDEKTMRNDLRHVIHEGLADRKTGIVNHTPTRLVTLTEDGTRLLDAHRDPEASGGAQQYHAGLVKPKELAHDVQFYRAFRAEAARIEATGGRVTRVVLDYELKRDYQQFLNRKDRSPATTFEADLQAFADARQLPVIDGHLELPDLRLEYDTADGRHETRDVEVVTEHYSRSQLAGKAAAGFALYRPARVSPFGRSGSAGRGGTPVDPHTLDWLR